MPNLDTLKDIARYFTNNSVQVRPAAARLVLEHTIVAGQFNEQRIRYLD